MVKLDSERFSASCWGCGRLALFSGWLIASKRPFLIRSLRQLLQVLLLCCILLFKHCSQFVVFTEMCKCKTTTYASLKCDFNRNNNCSAVSAKPAETQFTSRCSQTCRYDLTSLQYEKGNFIVWIRWHNMIVADPVGAFGATAFCWESKIQDVWKAQLVSKKREKAPTFRQLTIYLQQGFNKSSSGTVWINDSKMLFLKLLNVNEQKYKHATLNISINCCLQPYVKTLLYCRSVQLTFEDKTEFSCKKLGCARVNAYGFFSAKSFNKKTSKNTNSSTLYSKPKI